MDHTNERGVGRRRFLKLASSTPLAGIVLAACGAGPQTTSPTAASVATAPTAAPAAATTASVATAEPAAATTAPASEAIQLRYVYPIFAGPQKDQPMVQDALNALLQKKGLNAAVTLDALDGGAYNDKVNLMNTGGEEFDAVFTATWTNNYFQNVANGTLMPLDDLLASSAPKLAASVPKGVWDAVRVSGKIYSVPNQQKFPKMQGVAVRKDLAEKYKFDVDALTGYTDPKLTEFMQAVKDGEPDIKYVFTSYQPTEADIWGYDQVGGQLFAVVSFDDASAKVLNWFETPEFKQTATLFQSWNKAGFKPQEELKNEESDAMIKAGQVAMIMTQPTGPGGNVGLKQKYEQDFVVKALAPVVLSTGAVLATLTAIPASSEHPEAAIKFLELINTDPDVFHLISYGIEGTHYKLVDPAKGLIELTEDSGYNPNQEWAFGNTFQGYYTDPAVVGMKEQEKKINAEAKPSPIIGFSFDQVPVETELATISTALQEPIGVIYKGSADDLDAAIASLNKQLMDAGGDTVIAEMQKQIDAFVKAKA